MKLYYRIRKKIYRFLQSAYSDDFPANRLRHIHFIRTARKVMKTHRALFERLAKDD